MNNVNIKAEQAGLDSGREVDMPPGYENTLKKKNCFINPKHLLYV